MTPSFKLPLTTDIIYLHSGFIAQAFEEIHGEPTPTRISRSREVTCGASAAFLKLDAATREENEYPVSAFQMYSKIKSPLQKLPRVDMNNRSDLPGLFWTRGYLGVGLRRERKKDLEPSEYYHFSLCGNPKGGDPYIDLVTSNSFFTAGFEFFADAKASLAIHMWVFVKALLRLVTADTVNDVIVAAPMIMQRYSKTPDR